jgi:septal ring factor EnvC (AmiA/AmiB activator)
VAIRTMQTILTNAGRVRHTPFGRGIMTVGHRLSCAMALAIAPLMLGSCAQMMDFRTDIARLRSDLHTNTEVLSQLSARIDELERRQVATENTVRQTQQELTQAVAVLLKKALVAENRLSIVESRGSQPKGSEKSRRQARLQPSETVSAAHHGENSLQERKHLSLGMTQEDVRRTLGDPVSIENSGPYIFWQYSPMNNRKYVVFDKGTHEVWGWRGW